MQVRILHKEDFREGRWRNGLGVSWDIAVEGDTEDFDWRLALARIDGDVPFSAYRGIDRVFTVIEGEGLTLTVEGLLPIAALPLQPVSFPGDRPTSCRLSNGPCRALNLFTRRSKFGPVVRIAHVSEGQELILPSHSLAFVVDGMVRHQDVDVAAGDALSVNEDVALVGMKPGHLWWATLHPAGAA